ncbi:tetratricopeptide repeat protein [Geobacter pelophilus]|uniref:Tetratricopeptide repeat protein n=1 Tax=Geoanaerobacter pelophilus TaxID=60036 RepID=A0AAW4L2Y7_9BACT|nr:tetratricopeptide repeat protein [Geoanaerobacter pelophilus]MBT0665233.1 tetratricopeptide repeat protein [Geoanaerobacter pelophilus]
MGFFDKILGKNATEDTTTPGEVDFIAALAMHLRGEVDAALTTYARLAGEHPDDNLIPFFAAAAKASKGDIAEAAENLRALSEQSSAKGETISRAISLDLAALINGAPFLTVPAIAEIIGSLGDQLKDEGFVQASAVCFEIAAGLVPDNAHMLHKLGDTLHDLCIYDYAENVLQEALKHAPNHWGAIYTYAVLLQDLGRFAEAIDYYEKAVKLNPDHARCQNNYGAALMMSNQLEAALAHCTLAAELDPEFPLAQINLGNIQLLMQSYEAARNSFSAAIALDENLAKGYFGLGAAEESLGSDPGKIRELYLKAIELSPAFPEAHHALGNLLGRAGNPEALEHFAAAEQLDNTLADLQRDFGTVCLQLGQRQEALVHLRMALEQNPDDATAREILAQAEADNPA